ncbi:MAG TPA: ABC transporter permease, partial [Saprospiraceae bacterium]|nr:ABC transporter permease [Saprospiraceae bacterium]
MLSNDVKIAWRNFRKYKFFSALNVIGLALSMSASLLIITIVRNQFGYDKFHPAPERTYRLVTEAIRKEGGSEKYASTPYPLGTALRNDFAVAEAVTSLGLRAPNGDVTVAGRTLQIRSLYADPAFFHVFGFQLEAGNTATALTEPFSMVLTKETAIKFFGNENPLDKTLDIRGYGQFKVTGILQKIEHKTHFDFEALASGSTMLSLEKELTPEEAASAVSGDWTNYYATCNYVLLRPGKSKADLEVVLDEIASTRYAGMTLETRDKGYRFQAQSLSNISPAPEPLSQSSDRALPMFLIWGLLGFVVLLTIFPCLNYANLTIARALVRAKEVGIRKVMGAKRGELMRQFLTEAILTTCIALVLAWLLRFPLSSLITKLIPSELLQSDLYNPLQEDLVTWSAFAAFALFTGLIAGWLPARYLSRFRPDTALRDVSKIRLFSRLTLRKAMIVTQFTISLIFVIVVASMWGQLDYAMQTEYGFNKENIVEVRLQGQEYQALAAEIARDHRVLQVSASSHTVGTREDYSVDFRKSRDGDPLEMRNFFVDQNYIPNHGLQLITGKNFPADANPNRQQFVILNEKAVEFLGFGTPQDALGKTLWLNDSTEVAVHGVVKNYHFRPLTYSIGPLALLYAPRYFSQLDVRLAAGDPAGVLANIEGIWKKFDPVHDMEHAFLDQKLRDCYTEMKMMTSMVGFFGLLAISIACLGLLGIVTFTVETRGKEISIRKVIGASVADLTLLLSRNFLVLLGIAIVIALPVGYFLANQLLQFFAYRISIGP